MRLKSHAQIAELGRKKPFNEEKKLEKFGLKNKVIGVTIA